MKKRKINGSEIQWSLQSTKLLFLKEGSTITTLTTVMIFGYTSLIVVFSAKRGSRNTSDSR